MSDDKDNVVMLNGYTRLDIPANRVLEGAKDQLKDCIIIGWDKEDKLYIASSTAKTGDLMVLVKLAEDDLLSYMRGD